MELNEREKEILKIVIKDFIDKGIPVGSKSVVKNYNLKLSPATIRNELSKLEKENYLCHIYPSSGRVPTEKGYRFYIDSFEGQDVLTDEEKNWIMEDYKKVQKEIQSFLEYTSKLLSSFTQYVCLVSASVLSQDTLKYIKIIPLSSHNATVILITSSGVLEKKIISIPEIITPNVLNIVSEILNRRLQGLTMYKIKNLILKDIEEEIILRTHLFRETIRRLLLESLEVKEEEKIYLEGVLNMINQLEFQSSNKLKILLEFLNNKRTLSKMIKDFTIQDFSSDKVKVIIGKENKCEEMNECSIATIPYYLGKVQGFLAVLGPKRMQYYKVISALKFFSKNLSDTFGYVKT